MQGRIVSRMRYMILFLLSFPALAWDDTDRILGAAAVATLAYDWGQTRWASKYPCGNPVSAYCPDPYRESGLAKHVIGSTPTPGQVDRYFATCIVGTLLIAEWLPSSKRKIFLGTITAVELVVIRHNRQIGIQMQF